VKSAPQPQLEASSIPEERVPKIDRIDPPSLLEIASCSAAIQEPLSIEIHGQAFPQDAAAYLDGTLLNTEYVSDVCLHALIPPKLAAQPREFAVTVAYSRDRGLRLTNRCRLKIVRDSDAVPAQPRGKPRPPAECPPG
jgi:hypothetical protein